MVELEWFDFIIRRKKVWKRQSAKKRIIHARIFQNLYLTKIKAESWSYISGGETLMLSISIINLHNNINYITNDHSCDICGEAKR